MPEGVTRWPEPGQDFSKLIPAFPLETDNPIGRSHAVRALEAHNDLVGSAKTCLNTKESKHLKQYRKWRKKNPTFGLWGMTTMHEKFMKGVNDDVMGTGISRAKTTVDTSTPKVAWGFREWSDKQRENVLNDQLYKDSQGYEIQWSLQEAQHARRHLDMFERSKNAKGYLRCHGMIDEGHTTKQFRKWRNANRQHKLDTPLIIKPPFETKESKPLAEYPPTIAFPGPRSQTPDLSKKPAVEQKWDRRNSKLLSSSHYHMTTRLQVTGKVNGVKREKYEDEEEERIAQAQGLAPGTIHPRFGKTAGHDTPSDEFDPLQAGKVAMAEDSIVTQGSGRDNEIAAQADAAREHLLNALTTRAQQMSMQCASNDTVRALLVKQKKVREATNANKQKNMKTSGSRPHTSDTSVRSHKSGRSSKRGSTRGSSRTATSDSSRTLRVATAQAGMRRRTMEQERAQLNRDVQAAVAAGRAVAQSAINATGAMMQAQPPVEEEAEYMYKAHVLTDVDVSDAATLKVSQGDTVYVFEDDEHGSFECMDEHGIVGKLPQNVVQFEESVPKMRPQDMRHE